MSKFFVQSFTSGQAAFDFLSGIAVCDDDCNDPVAIWPIAGEYRAVWVNYCCVEDGNNIDAEGNKYNPDEDEAQQYIHYHDGALDWPTLTKMGRFPIEVVAPEVSLNIYQTAIDIQSACNVSALAHALSRCMNVIWNEARKCDSGTDYVNKHPVVRMFLHQMAHLSGVNSDLLGDSWHELEGICQLNSRRFNERKEGQ